ncbi:MAG: SH3 domain-containing protein [Pseudomonadota bacterium]
MNFLRLALFALLLAAQPLQAREYRKAVVAEPYLELRTGPAKGYPVVQVVERGGHIEIIKSRTDWYKVRADDDREGWVRRSEMELTLNDGGEFTTFEEDDFSDYESRRWEMGALTGDFAGANVISIYGGYAFTANLSAELWVSQALGSFSNSTFTSINLLHQTFPDWRFSPYFTLGAGVIRTSPNATLIETEDRTDEMAHAGIGIRAYINRHFLLRAEYKSYVVFTSRDENEEPNEWKAGFSFFF